MRSRVRWFGVTLAYVAVFVSCVAVVRTVSASHRLRVAVVVDTIVADGQFTVPSDDGRGPLDSIRVDLMGIGTIAPSRTWRPPLPVGTLTYQLRGAVAPFSGSAEFEVRSFAFSFRRGLATRAESNTVTLTLSDLSPPSVTGHTITAVKVP